MTRDDIEEMYPSKTPARKKKQYSGLACIINHQKIPQTELMPVGLAKNKLKKEYRGLKGYRLLYDFKWV